MSEVKLMDMTDAAIAWAREHVPEAAGFNSGECGCLFEDPAPCWSDGAMNCKIAKRVDCLKCENLSAGECGAGFDFCMESVDCSKCL